MHIPLFYKPKASFGLDISSRSIKIAEIRAGQHPHLLGYSYGQFDPTASVNGELVKPEAIATTVKDMLHKHTSGKIGTNRVMMSVPVSHSFIRIMHIPELAANDIEEAVRLEADQYIPVPSDQLYIEHLRIDEPPTAKGAEKTMSVLVVAVPKKIIDSHIKLCELLNLEIAGIEPSIFANLRAVHNNCPQQVPKIVIDFGARSSDLAIYDSSLQLASTVHTGGDDITSLIAHGLSVTIQDAAHIKTRYGISKSKWQVQLASILQPVLSDFANEVQKAMRYYHEHSGGKNVSDIFMVGGGANMPGLADFMSHLTGVRVQICNPWTSLSINPLRPPNPSETTVYTTAIGLALNEVTPDD